MPGLAQSLNIFPGENQLVTLPASGLQFLREMPPAVNVVVVDAELQVDLERQKCLYRYVKNVQFKWVRDSYSYSYRCLTCT